MNDILPTKNEVKEVLLRLSRGELSREKASEWAIAIINNDSINVNDLDVWEVLQFIGAVDLPSTDRNYLYEKADFDDWLEKLI